MPGAIVCEEKGNLRGDITISAGTIVHPSATIIAESGPIIIGENCIIEEYAKIIYRIPESHPKSDKPTSLIIGRFNIFEVGCTVEALEIGENNVFECKSYVSSDVTVSNNCIIGAGCKLIAKQDLKENTVIYGANCHQRETIGKQGSQMLQLDFLKKVLPNYHHLRKGLYDPKKIRSQV